MILHLPPQLWWDGWLCRAMLGFELFYLRQWLHRAVLGFESGCLRQWLRRAAKTAKALVRRFLTLSLVAVSGT